MEAGNRCKDECLPEETNRRIVDIISDVNIAYSENARRNLADCGLPPERTFVVGSPMTEVLSCFYEKILMSDILEREGLKETGYMLLSVHREEKGSSTPIACRTETMFPIETPQSPSSIFERVLTEMPARSATIFC